MSVLNHVFTMIVFSAVLLAYPIGTFGQTESDQLPFANDPPIEYEEIPSSLLEKFDGDLYAKLRDIASQSQVSGATGTADEPRYSLLIIINESPDSTLEQDKQAVVSLLGSYGAQNIRPATSLSFVTADVPVSKIAELSVNPLVNIVGDGELEFEASIDIARQVIQGNPIDLRIGSTSQSYTGEGVRVAVLDSGINAAAINANVVGQTYCDNNAACTSVIPPLTGNHGTAVAGIIAASGIGNYGGIAQGVDLLDGFLERDGISREGVTIITRATEFAHGLQWALDNNADIVNISTNIYFTSTITERENACIRAKSVNFVTEEAVDKGMTVVVSVGNAGATSSGNAIYKSIAPPACAKNVISVGASDDSNGVNFSQFKMYSKTNRGPTTDGLLKPDLVAPGTNIQTVCGVYADGLCSNDGNAGFRMTRHNTTFFNDSGTSLAAPMVAAASAILKEANPSYTPLQIKSALLLGADWTAPVPCTSVQFEANNSADKCSNAYNNTSKDIAIKHEGLSIINNVGFGILDIKQSLAYTEVVDSVSVESKYIISENIRQLQDGYRLYTFNVDSTQEPVKVILSWFANPGGSVISQVSADSVYTPSIDMIITKPDGTIIHANSTKQVSEFAVFVPDQTGTYTVKVSATSISTGLDLMYALASTQRLTVDPNAPPVIKLIQSEITAREGQTVTLDASKSIDKFRKALTFSWSQVQNGAIPVEISGSSNSIATFVVPDGNTPNPIPLLFSLTVSNGDLESNSMVTVTPIYDVIYPITLFSDDFESSLSKWSHISSRDRWNTYGGSAVPAVPQHSSSNSVLHSEDCDDNCIIETSDAIDLLKYDNVTLSFWRYVQSTFDSGEYVRIEGTGNTGVRNTMAEWSAENRNINDMWHRHEIPLINYSLNTDFEMRITSVSNSYSENAAMDDITITMTGLSPFYDTFEKLDKWTENGWNALPHIERHQNTGTWPQTDKVAEAKGCPFTGCILESSTIDLSNMTGSAGLYFWRFIDRSLDPGEYLKVEFYNGTSWALISQWDAGLYTGPDDDTWHQEIFDIPSEYFQSEFKIRFTTNPSHAVENVAINNLAIKTTGSSAPAPAPEPEPEPEPEPTQNILYEFDSVSEWINTGNRDWRATTPNRAVPDTESGNNVAHSANCDSLCIMDLRTPLNLSGYSSATLSLWRYLSSGLDYGEYLKVEVYDGSAWHTAFDWQASERKDDNTWHQETYEIPSSYLASNFDIRLTAKSSKGSEIAMVDKLSIMGSSGSTPSGTPDSGTQASGYALYVSSSDSSEIQRYRLDGTFIDDFVDRGSGGLRSPWGLDFGPDGRLYVADALSNKILRYDSSGNPAGSGTSAAWADTSSRPYGIKWNDGILYVASRNGIERFDSRGNSLGYYGDASNSPSVSTTPRLFIPYDVAFGGGKMYATVLYRNQLFEYAESTGRYTDTISVPSIAYSKGLAWDPTGTTSLLASGDDTGKIVRINPSTERTITSYTRFIDEPYGMTVDSDGNIYVANKDDDNVVKITGTQATALIPSRANGMDDPFDVAIGPAPPAGAAGAVSGAAEPILPINEEPEFAVYLPDGTETYTVDVSVGANSTRLKTWMTDGTETYTNIVPTNNTAATLSLEIRGTDEEGDAITYSLNDAPDFVSLTEPVDGIAALEFYLADVESDAYIFSITASDSNGNSDSYDYILVITDE